MNTGISFDGSRAVWRGVRFLAAAQLSTALAMASMPCSGQVELRSAVAQANAQTTEEFLKAMGAVPGDVQHGIATFLRNPTNAERKALQAQGLHVLAPLGGTTYRVRVEKRVTASSLDASPLKPVLLRLRAEDRVDPRVWSVALESPVAAPPARDLRNYFVNADGSLTLSVRVHSGIAAPQARDMLRRHARSVVQQGDQTWVAVVPRASLQALAGEDAVLWIDPGPLPYLPENNAARAEIRADAVQMFNSTTGTVNGLGGRGVRVGLFDFGLDEDHQDFTGRIAANDAPRDGHATHIAGMIAGDGKMSAGADSTGASNGGTPYQWRGMAPLAQLLDIFQEPPFGQNGMRPATHLTYIRDHGMHVSNHSYVFSVDGAYDESNKLRDQIIRGDALVDGVPVPPRLAVTSAGNNGLTAQYGVQKGYFSLTKQSKNALVVGNWDSIAQQVAQTSSLGPAHDGRIKPDVVAPGNLVKSTGYCPPDGSDAAPFCWNTSVTPSIPIERHSSYRVKTGTSMASGAATGAVALLLEQHRRSYGPKRFPRPSTVRGVIIHSARDLAAGSSWFTNSEGDVQATPGPDFVTGWGLVDAKAAVDIVKQKLLREGSVTATCHLRSYTFDVSPGRGGVRVTLAWDDVAADPALAPTSPKLLNDLDIALVDPKGKIHLPWKLDQFVVDAGGNPVGDAHQGCGMALRVIRQFRPDPANITDPVPSAGVPVARRGRDRLNNVEVVDAPRVVGRWRAYVLGFNVVQGPQPFSLIGGVFKSLTP